MGDGGGLYLRVKASGSKSWSFVWKHGGKRTESGNIVPNEIGLGPYPAITLADARKKAAKYRELVANGGNPKTAKAKTSEPTFEECVGLFLDSMESQWRNPKHRAQWRMTLGESYCKPILTKHVSEINTEDVLGILTPHWQTKHETASRIRGRLERVLDYAKARGWRIELNPALWRGHLKSLLPARQKLTRGHHAGMPYKQLPAFIDRLRRHEATAARTLEFLILTAGRSGEVLGAKWGEIDFEEKVWSVPAERMKTSREHRVPLSYAALAILGPLNEARVSDYIFPGQQLGRPLSSSTMEMLMRRMNAKPYTVHGFRSSFRDWIGEETNFSFEAAELSLSHNVGDETVQAYRRGDALEKRRTLMEAWANYLDGEQSNKIVRFQPG